MNITTWVPLEYVDTKPRQRPLSVHNPTIPDLRSYLDSGKSSQTKKTLVQQTKDETKASRRMSAPVPALSTNKMKRVSQQPVIQEIETLSPTSTNTPPLSQSMSRTTTNSSISSTTRSPLYNNNKNNNNENVTPTISRSSSTTMMTRSNSTRTTGSNGSNTSVGGTVYRPGQTATVRARAEAAKKRQLQLEEEKKKKEMQAQLASRTSLKLKQQAKSGIDWDAIKKERRKTIL
ncbi:hypothetical protein BJ944DRAFT_272078 [Cunninghamella echinulata]|nr:hypothetical protein BJ944DRAFT_272078 [Cunninghamella echinulata]